VAQEIVQHVIAHGNTKMSINIYHLLSICALNLFGIFKSGNSHEKESKFLLQFCLEGVRKTESFFPQYNLLRKRYLDTPTSNSNTNTFVRVTRSSSRVKSGERFLNTNQDYSARYRKGSKKSSTKHNARKKTFPAALLESYYLQALLHHSLGNFKERNVNAKLFRLAYLQQLSL
jgi:hypothetical protein